MKGFKLNSKNLFVIWVISFVLVCVFTNVYVSAKMQMYAIDEKVITDSFGYKLVLTLFVSFWFLPLAIAVFHNAKNTNRVIRRISGAIIVWLTISVIILIITLIGKILTGGRFTLIQ